MAELGVLRGEHRVELVEGEIVEMSPIGSRHAACVTACNDAFHACAINAVIWVQCSIEFPSHTQLQPDVALLRPRADRYAAGLPRPDDVLLVVEAADSSLVYDRDTKARLYARAGIEEYWLVDLTRSTLWMHRHPAGERYTAMTAMQSGETASRRRSLRAQFRSPTCCRDELYGSGLAFLTELIRFISSEPALRF
ncbi:MAG: Uma2 family endonuclease [Gammaproteobacteria bacterium]|nr:Uma2 family endonuclease [Gammaproteobacteria bacterium]